MNQLHNHSLTPGQKIAYKIHDGFGSWTCLWLHVAWFALWLFFGADIMLLTLIVSLEAIFLTILVMIGQNLQEHKDEQIVDYDYQHDATEKAILETLSTQLKRLESKVDALANDPDHK